MSLFTIFLITSAFLFLLGLILVFSPFENILLFDTTAQESRRQVKLRLEGSDIKKIELDEIDSLNLTDYEMLGFLENNTRKLNWSLQKSLNKLDNTLEKISGDLL